MKAAVQIGIGGQLERIIQPNKLEVWQVYFYRGWALGTWLQNDGRMNYMEINEMSQYFLN